MFTIDMMIGGIAGVISRTLTAPLELNKIQQQKPTTLEQVAFFTITFTYLFTR